MSLKGIKKFKVLRLIFSEMFNFFFFKFLCQFLSKQLNMRNMSYCKSNIIIPTKNYFLNRVYKNNLINSFNIDN